MQEKENSKHQISVAWIGAIGVVIAALITVFGKGEEGNHQQPPPPIIIDNNNINQIVTTDPARGIANTQNVDNLTQNNKLNENLPPNKKIIDREIDDSNNAGIKIPDEKKHKNNSNLSPSNTDGINKYCNEIKEHANEFKLKLKKMADETTDSRARINYTFWFEYFDKVLRYDNKSIIEYQKEIDQAFFKASKLFNND